MNAELGWPYRPKPYQTRVRYVGRDGRMFTLSTVHDATCLEFAEKLAKTWAKARLREMRATPGTIVEVRTIPYEDRPSVYSRAGMKEA